MLNFLRKIETPSAQSEALLNMTSVEERQDELEQNLQAALAIGPNAIGQQVRHILASARKIPPAGITQSYAESVVTMATARLVALVQFGESLTEAQRDQLVKEARALPPSPARYNILLRLAHDLPAPQRQSIVGEVWTAARAMPDTIARTRVLFRLAGLLHVFQDEHTAPASLLPVVTAAQAINNSEARIRSLTAIVPHLPHNMRVRMLHRLFDEIDRLPNDRLRGGAVIALAEFLPAEVEARALRSAEFIQTSADRARTLMALSPHLPPSLQPRLQADTLEAIETTPTEDERAELLIAFASHLEYGTGGAKPSLVWEQTLRVVSGLTRRPLRARALVALAPHSPTTLLREALSAISRLTNEHDRAVLLAGLAPSLPVDQVGVCVDMARAIEASEARTLALIALARCAPVDLRQLIAQEALPQVASLSNTYERVMAYMTLADILSNELYVQTFESALNIDNENARARAMSLLASRLPVSLLSRALQAAEQFTAPNLRISVLSSIAPMLVGEARRATQRRLMETTQEIQLDYKRARALVSIAPLLPADLLDEVHIAAEALDDPFDRVIVYIAIAQNLPPDQRPPVIAHAWTLIKEIESGYDSASAIAAISPFLPEMLHADLIQTAGSIINAIRDEYDRASAIGILAPLLLAEDHPESMTGLPDSFLALEEALSAALDTPHQAMRAQLLGECVTVWMDIGYFEQSYRLWRGVAMRLAELPLADVILCLNALLPILRELSGEEGMADIAHVLLDY
jgi:hypothetical protein